MIFAGVAFPTPLRFSSCASVAVLRSTSGRENEGKSAAHPCRSDGPMARVNNNIGAPKRPAPGRRLYEANR